MSASGLVAVTADLAARYTVFAVCLQRLEIPEGAQVRWQLGSDVAANRNRAVQDLLASGQEWLWFIDDDHAFPPDILLRLLQREVDVVSPLCLRRNGNFLPVPCVTNEKVMELGEHEPDELVHVAKAGTAGMLIRRSVFEQVPEPWFEFRNGRSEDVVFCEKLQEADVPIHVDMSARLGHVTTAVVWPTFEDGWRTGFQFADGFEVAVETSAPVAC